MNGIKTCFIYIISYVLHDDVFFRGSLWHDYYQCRSFRQIFILDDFLVENIGHA